MGQTGYSELALRFLSEDTRSWLLSVEGGEWKNGEGVKLILLSFVINHLGTVTLAMGTEQKNFRVTKHENILFLYFFVVVFL